MLQHVPYDVLRSILSTIDSRHLLLSLALTSHFMHDVIIPEFLYARIVFLWGGDVKKISKFCRFIYRKGPNTHRSVRHLDLGCADKRNSVGITGKVAFMLSDVIARLTELRSIVFNDWYLNFETCVFSKALSSLPHLSAIEIAIYNPVCLVQLRDIRPLRSISISSELGTLRKDGLPYAVTRYSAVWSMLHNSRATLERLRLGDVIWAVDIPPQIGAPDEDVWPEVHTLVLKTLEVDSNCTFSLSSSFPSTRRFTFPETNSDWAATQPDFLARLESVAGDWAQIQATISAGAKLHRIEALHCRLPAGLTPPGRIFPELRSLHLSLRYDSSVFIGQLARVTPNLTFLHIDISCPHTIEPGAYIVR